MAFKIRRDRAQLTKSWDLHRIPKTSTESPRTVTESQGPPPNPEGPPPNHPEYLERWQVHWRPQVCQGTWTLQCLWRRPIPEEAGEGRGFAPTGLGTLLSMQVKNEKNIEVTKNENFPIKDWINRTGCRTCRCWYFKRYDKGFSQYAT